MSILLAKLGMMFLALCETFLVVSVILLIVLVLVGVCAIAWSAR